MSNHILEICLSKIIFFFHFKICKIDYETDNNVNTKYTKKKYRS